MRHGKSAILITKLLEAWRDKIPGIWGLGPSDIDFEMGIDNPCDVERFKAKVQVSPIQQSGNRRDH